MHRLRLLFPALAILLLAGSAAAACGGDDDENKDDPAERAAVASAGAGLTPTPPAARGASGALEAALANPCALITPDALKQVAEKTDTPAPGTLVGTAGQPRSNVCRVLIAAPKGTGPGATLNLKLFDFVQGPMPGGRDAKSIAETAAQAAGAQVVTVAGVGEYAAVVVPKEPKLATPVEMVVQKGNVVLQGEILAVPGFEGWPTVEQATAFTKAVGAQLFP